MAVTPYSVRVQTAEELEDELNAILAPLTANFIYGVELDQVRSGPSFLRNLLALLTSSSGGTAIAEPFKFKTFVSADENTSILLANQFIAANPTYFFSQIFGVTRPSDPDPNQGVIFGIFYCEDSNAADNWTNVPTSANPEYSGNLNAGSNILDSVPMDQAGAVMWYLEIEDLTPQHRYSSTVNAVHDSSGNAWGTEGSVVFNPAMDTGVFTVDVGVSGTDMTLIVTISETGWVYRVRRQTLSP
jgi:hypothetical protein